MIVGGSFQLAGAPSPADSQYLPAMRYANPFVSIFDTRVQNK